VATVAPRSRASATSGRGARADLLHRHRPDVGVRVRVAVGDREPRGQLRDAVDEVAQHGPLDVDPVDRDADLAGVAERAADGAGRGEVEVRVA